MNILFNFPPMEGVSKSGSMFKVHMNSVPREGEEISMSRVEPTDFEDETGWKLFANHYRHKDWHVQRVIWSPMRGGYSFVNILLA